MPPCRFELPFGPCTGLIETMLANLRTREKSDFQSSLSVARDYNTLFVTWRFVLCLQRMSSFSTNKRRMNVVRTSQTKPHRELYDNGSWALHPSQTTGLIARKHAFSSARWYSVTFCSYGTHRCYCRRAQDDIAGRDVVQKLKRDFVHRHNEDLLGKRA